jgi:hypothetical protein
MKLLTALLTFILISGCANTPLHSPDGKNIPERAERNSANQFMKTDFDRMADLELAENMQSLKTLMLKLYKRNPRELAKSTSENAGKMVEWVFEGESQHHWQFKEINYKQGTEALYLTFDESYQGDRVLPFIVGLSTMFKKVHGNKKSFFFTDSLEPQLIYNAARNVEIAAWKLSTNRKSNGELYLISNEINDHESNLSFEREFGKIIGRTDLYAFLLEEKSQRFISKMMQSIATATFLPF